MTTQVGGGVDSTGKLRIVIVGATSSIATHVARLYAGRGARFVLVARDKNKLDAVATDLAARGGSVVGQIVCGTLDDAAHQRAVDQAVTLLGGIDVALIAQGTLGDQKLAEDSFAEVRRIFEVNTLDVMSWATRLANVMVSQGRGRLGVISSVAGDLGRLPIYVYGASKAALNVFFDGLAIRMYRAGARATTIKPGPVATPMTAGLGKQPLLAQPGDVAAAIVRGLDRGCRVVYTPWPWRVIMLILTHLPFAIRRRLNF
jgi:decaprenylphospho-beta-D-erythro-pentofuranosid-2-ulose 2-reductase